MQAESLSQHPEKNLQTAPREWWVCQENPQASDSGAGTRDAPLLSISAAARRAGPGDRVRIGTGIYRERVAPANGGVEGSPITYEALPGQRAVLRGSDPISPEAWTPCTEAPGVWRLPLSQIPAPDDAHPFRLGNRGYRTPVRPHAPENTAPVQPVRGQLFLNGQLQHQVTDPGDVLRTPGLWAVDPQGESLLFHPPPASRSPSPFPYNHLVECSVRERIFAPQRRHLGHIHLRNLTFEHCANFHPTPQIAAVSVRAGHHWLIEGCTIRFANTLGLDLGTEWGIEDTPEHDNLDLNHPRGRDFEACPAGDHLVRNNIISDNGLCGIVGIHQYRTRLLNNRIERNNSLGFRTFEIGSVKFHFFFDGLIEGNLIRDNDAYGIWLDNRYAGTRVHRNLILNNYIAGVFVEMGLGPVLIDHNIIAYTRNGDGLYAHDASGITLAHNLLYANAHCGVNLTLATDRNARDGFPVRCCDNLVRHNIIAASKRAAISFPVPWERALRNQSDHNAFMGGGNPMDEGTGPDAPLFHLNRSHNRLTPEQVLDTLGPAAAPLHEAAGAGLDLWQTCTENDQHSRIIHVRRDMLATLGLHIDIIWDPELTKAASPPLPEFDGTPGYFGEILPPGTPLPPGPFRRYYPGQSRRRPLWPLPLQPRNILPGSDDSSADIQAVWASFSGLNTPGI